MRCLSAILLFLVASSASASDKDVTSNMDAEKERERELKASAIYKDNYGKEGLDEITRAINEVSDRAIKKDFIVRSMQKESVQPKSVLSYQSNSTIGLIKDQVSNSKNWGKQLTIKTTTHVQGLYENLVFGGYSYKVLTEGTIPNIR